MGQDSINWGDRVAEVAGAGALGAGTGASAWLVAPLGGISQPLAAAVAGLIGVATGWLVVRLTPGREVGAPLPTFDVMPIEPRSEDAAVLLLLTGGAQAAANDSRVVQLFDPPHPATPGDLQTRIAAHLADPMRTNQEEAPSRWDGPQAIPDASDALHAALADIRRSLRAS